MIEPGENADVERELWRRARPASDRSDLEARYADWLDGSEERDELLLGDPEIARSLADARRVSADSQEVERLLAAILPQPAIGSSQAPARWSAPTWWGVAASVAVAASAGLWAGVEISRQVQVAQAPPVRSLFLADGGEFDSFLVTEEAYR